MSLHIDEFIALKDEGYQVLDLRNPADFGEAFIPGSLNIAMDDDFTDMAKYFIFKTQKLILIAEQGWEEYCVRKMKALDYKKVGGFLFGGMKTWIEHNKPIDVVISVEADELAMDLKYDDRVYIDIRNSAEYEKSHMQESDNVDPIVLIEDPDILDDKTLSCIFCANGKMSMALISYLKTLNKHNIHHVSGGYREIQNNPDIPLVVPKKK